MSKYYNNNKYIIPNDIHIKIFTNIRIHILNNKLSELLCIQDRNETEHEMQLNKKTSKRSCLKIF